MQFDESKHPRDKAGKFTDGLGNKDIQGLEQAQRRELKNERVIEVDAKTGKPKFGMAKAPEFVDTLVNAKAAIAKMFPERSWRVSSPSAEEFEQEHPGAEMHITPGGSTVAVTSDGDIVAVCKKPGDKQSGSDLLKMAVANGGKKLDSYEGNHSFYMRNGFEPISWCKWDDEFAPPDWKQDYEKEDIIFYRYTGKPTTESLADFKKRVAASADYSEAAKLRDNSLEEYKNE